MTVLMRTGIPGLDAPLGGGIPRNSMVIVEGEPGTGKSTTGLQFICEGALQYHEPGVYISLEELPDDIYKNATQFGYDLKQLENDGLVRVIGCAPELFFEQVHGSEAYLQSMVKEIGAQRMVIDSLNLILLTERAERDRGNLYSLFQALRRLSLTVLLVRECTSDSGTYAIEHFVCDGIIHLGKRSHDDTFSSRTLQVTKMRRSAFDAREFVFRISSSGIYVASPMGSIPTDADLHWMAHREQFEIILSQTLVTGSVTLFDISSLVHLLPIKKAIMRHRLKQGDTQFIWSLSASTTIQRFLEMSPEIMDSFLDGRIRFIEHLRRTNDFENHPYVLNATKFNLDEYRNFLMEKIVASIVESRLSSRTQWLLGYDINDVHNVYGSEAIIRIFPEIAAYERALGLTTVILVNLNEISGKVRAMLERCSDHIVHIWVERGYEYLQVVKGSFEWSSRPFLVETQSKSMDIGLV